MLSTVKSVWYGVFSCKILNFNEKFSEVRSRLNESEYSITKYMPKVSMESLSAVRSFLWAKQIEVEKLL